MPYNPFHAVPMVAAMGLLLSPALAPAQTADRDAAWAALQKCGAITDDEARHACSDEAMKKAGLLAPPEARAAEHRRRFGVEAPKFRPPRIARAPAAPAEPQAAGAAHKARPAPALVDDADRIEVALSEVQMKGDGKLSLVTKDGAVWRQAELERVLPRPTPGQAMVIEKRALGGYICKIGRWTSFRCTRQR